MKYALFGFFMLPLVLVSETSLAEDIEIYVSNPAAERSIQSNVLMVVDTSGSMRGWVEIDNPGTYGDDLEIDDHNIPWQDPDEDDAGDPYYLTRMEITQDVTRNLVETTSDVNFSLMRYRSEYGGYVDIKMKDITNADNKAEFKAALAGYNYGGWTPLEESYYEAYLYFKGGAPDYGTDGSGNAYGDAAAIGGDGKYISPITDICQNNNIILFTDGKPTQDEGANSEIRTLISGKLPAASAVEPLEPPAGTAALDGSCDGDGDCMDELSYYLKNYVLTGSLNQTISTYTVGGFGLSGDAVDLLEDTATRGGGQYFSADNSEQLSTALSNIVSDILSESSTFVGPAVSVSAFNSLQHSNELYYALFEAVEGPKWNGNLKRYGLNSDNQIVDVNGNTAIADEASGGNEVGFFKLDSKSWWSASADPLVSQGGMANELTDPGARKLFTYTSGGSPSEVILDVAAHRLDDSNAAITKAMLDVSGETDAYRVELLDWARGVDVDDEDGDNSVGDARNTIGDPLHNQPVIINYGISGGEADSAAFFSTNEGFVHAVDTSDGSEKFAFIPEELLPNLNIYRTNDSAISGSKVYGLDGAISAWYNDVNGDGTISGSDHVYIYSTMRRGGRNIYALDVTNRASPILKWMIKGGTGDFVELGQTWSKPILAKIKLNNISKTVLIFGAGYDTDQDGEVSITADDVGRGIYIVDADTGVRLWWASNAGSNLNLADMNYSIPADVTVGDVNNDGYADFIFAADMGGQVWRFDIDNDDNTGVSNLIAGGVIAKLSGNTDADGRRFYNAPDVALINHRGDSFLTVSIGSGFRAHPLNTDTEHDQFYMIKDPHAFSKPSSYLYAETNGSASIIGVSHLYDATANNIQSSTQATAQIARESLSNKSGWLITMDAGEKVLAKSITFDNKLLFSTYTPSQGNAGCSPDRGAGRLYLVNLLDATPVLSDLDGDLLEYEPDDRIHVLVRGGIPPMPTIINAYSPVICVGTECLSDISFGGVPYQKRFWRENKHE